MEDSNVKGLANHNDPESCVFDLWVQHWRKTKAKGDVIVVRSADDFVVGFQSFLLQLRSTSMVIY
jgi:hypothetical protein